MCESRNIMKGLKIFLVPILMSSFVIYYGCNNDDGQTPTITLMSQKLVEGIYNASEGELITVGVVVVAPGGFQLLQVSYEGINKSTEQIVPPENGMINYSHTYNLDNWLYGIQPFTITFTAIDNSNKSSAMSVVVKPDGPTIALTADNPDIRDDSIIAFVNQKYVVNYRYVFPAGFVKFSNKITIDGTASETVTTSLPPTQGTSVTDRIEQTMNSEFLNKEITYFLEITDKFGETASLEIPLSLTQKLSEIIRDVELEYPSADKSSNTFFSTNTGQTYSLAEVNANKEELTALIDFGYYYNDTDKASLTGPANYITVPSTYNLGPSGDNWTNLNVTNFKKSTISEGDFDALGPNNQEEITSAYNNAPANPVLIIKDLQIGDIIAFKTFNQKTGGGKEGLLKVKNLITGTGSDGKIVFDVITNQ